jgi:hypothetical protein
VALESHIYELVGDSDSVTYARKLRPNLIRKIDPLQNDALDDLRHVIPYAHSPSVRKLSKIATLLLAKNYILMQVGDWVQCQVP